MALDFGFYNSLRAKQDLNQKRADDNMMLGIAQQMKQEATQKAQENAQSLGMVSDYFRKEKEMESQLLDQDAKRVQGAEKELRKSVIGQLTQYNNDPNMFMLMGGKGVMDKYYGDLINLKELKTGINNKQSLNQFLKDTAEGKMPNLVTPRNPDGTPMTDASGNPMRVPMDKALGMFYRGEINQIPYEGAFEVPKVDITDFLHYPDPTKGKYKGFVGEDYSHEYLKRKGALNNEQANQILPFFKNPKVPGASILMWGEKKQDYWDKYAAMYAAKSKYGDGTAKDFNFPLKDMYSFIKGDTGYNVKDGAQGKIDAVRSDAFKGTPLLDENGYQIDVIDGIEKVGDKIYPLLQSHSVGNGKYSVLQAPPINDNWGFIKSVLTAKYGKGTAGYTQKMQEWANSGEAPEDLAQVLNIPTVEGSTSKSSNTSTTQNGTAKYSASMPDGTLIYSDDGQTWTDANGKKVE